MRTFILTDAANLFHRQINMVNPSLDIDSKIGMGLHMILHSTKKEYKKWQGNHLVFFTEGKSWRKNIYKEYKADRAVTFSQLSPKDQEERKVLLSAFNDFTEYLVNHTNVTVLHNPVAEADDMIYNWVYAHPNDKHILISSDSDFFQLLQFPNVMLYDPVKDIQIRHDGIYNDNGDRLEFTLKSDAKIKVGDKNPLFECEQEWYKYALFLKTVRGDKTDNIFSAYPGVREAGTKKTIGIREAYKDSIDKGYNYNNFMLQRWTDHNGVEHQVKDRVELNRKLIDLSAMPDEIKEACLETIRATAGKTDVNSVHVGHHFGRFCTKWDLRKIGEFPEDFMNMLKAKYE